MHEAGGGKDSCYNMMQCVAEGHDIVALANLKPKDKDELDSYMYQTVGHHAIDLYAEAMNLPLYRRTIEGGSIAQGRDYHVTPEDEVEDLYVLLKQIKDEIGIEGVSVGAILSDYQRVRVENVCLRLGLTPLAYLWRRDQEELMKEMIDSHVHAIIIKVAALGLLPNKHLGLTLGEIFPHMKRMKEKYGLNICGEGGEFETFTLDCPLFDKKIIIDELETVIHSDDAFAPVGYLNFKKMHLEDKKMEVDKKIADRLKDLPMKMGDQLLRELFADNEVESITDQCETLPSDGAVSQKDICYDCVREQLSGDFNPSVGRGNKYLSISGVHGKLEESCNPKSVTKKAMDILKDCLSTHGLKMKDIVLMHIYVKNMKDFAEINSVYKTYFSINPPARVCVETNLPQDVVLLLNCIALNSNCNDRLTMHVQGLSHWAPANIGPYSQAVKVDNSIFVAGCVPLCPSNLQVVAGGIVAQCRLTLRSLSRILAAMHSGAGLHSVTMAVCYVTDTEHVAPAKSEWNRTAQTDSDQSNDCTPTTLVTYVVVPSLPRNVLVEWEVRATTSHLKQRKATHLSKETAAYHIHGFTISQSPDSFNIDEEENSENDQLGINLAVDYKQQEAVENNSVVAANSVKAILRDCIDLCLAAVKENMIVPCMRIFYKQDQISSQHIQQAFRQWKESSDIEWSCVCIPVKCLENSSQVLSACF